MVGLRATTAEGGIVAVYSTPCETVVPYTLTSRANGRKKEKRAPHPFPTSKNSKIASNEAINSIRDSNKQIAEKLDQDVAETFHEFGDDKVALLLEFSCMYDGLLPAELLDKSYLPLDSTGLPLDAEDWEVALIKGTLHLGKLVKEYFPTTYTSEFTHILESKIKIVAETKGLEKPVLTVSIVESMVKYVRGRTRDRTLQQGSVVPGATSTIAKPTPSPGFTDGDMAETGSKGWSAVKRMELRTSMTATKQVAPEKTGKKTSATKKQGGRIVKKTARKRKATPKQKQTTVNRADEEESERSFEIV